MSRKNKLLSSIVISGFILAISSCASVSEKVVNHNLKTDVTDLELDKTAEPTILYRRKDAPSLGAYNSFIIDPVAVDYQDPTVNKIAAEDLARIQKYFQKSVSDELKKSGYTVTDQPGDETMRISFILSGIKAPSAKANVVAAILPIAISVGEVTVEATFSESRSSRVDYVAVSQGRGSRVLNMTPWSTWADVESTFDGWAEGIAEAVNQAHQ